MVEVIKGTTIPKEELSKRVKLKNPKLMSDYIDDGQSVILLTAHQCNWEWILLGSSAEFSFPLEPVYKPLSSPFFQQLMLDVRSRFGSKPIAMKDTMREIVRRKNTPSVFGLVADQAPMRHVEKQWEKFLNQDSAFYVGGAKIARSTKYPVLFMSMCRTRRGYYEIDIKKVAEPPYPINMGYITHKYAALLEESILENPADWLWSHNRWKYEKD